MYRTLLHLVESGSIGERVQGKQRQHLVVPDEDFAQSPVRFAILEFLSVGQLEKGQGHVQRS